MRNVAIIISDYEDANKKKIIRKLSCALMSYYNVFLFLVGNNEIENDYAGQIVHIEGADPFYEYSLMINKQKYNISVTISISKEMNFINVRSRANDKIIVIEESVSGFENNLKTAENTLHQWYQKYADEIVLCSNGEQEKAMSTDRWKLLATQLFDVDAMDSTLILDMWRTIIEKNSRNPIEYSYTEMKRLKEASEIYIYGAGYAGKLFYVRLSRDYEIKGFVVSKRNNTKNELYGLPILQLDEVKNKTALFVIGVGFLHRDDVVSRLLDYGITNISFPVVYPMHYDYYVNTPRLNIKDELMDWSRLMLERNFDIDHPNGYNEKIQWLKLYDSTNIKTQLSDKVLVRDYVKNKVGEKYLIPMLGVWESFEDVDFSVLPRQFVMKYNHASGTNLIVYNKEELNYQEEQIKFEQWKKRNYAFVSGFEMHYAGIKPQILVEELLVSEDGEDLKDYKVFVFNGVAKYIQVDIGRHHEHRRNIYDVNWNYIPVSILYPTVPEIQVEKPKVLERLVELAEILGNGFRHVRVDFYICNEKIYFGEMTFTHGSGIEKFEPAEFEMEMGELIDCSEGSV